MEKILVSACLIGEPVRYDGTAATFAHPLLERWLQEERVVPVCPEVAAGLGTPRPPVELAADDGTAVLEGRAAARGRGGEDVTGAFLAGARLTLDTCRRLRIREILSPKFFNTGDENISGLERF